MWGVIIFDVNLLIPLLALMPNLLLISFPSKNTSKRVIEKGSAFLMIFEGIGRVGVMAVPIFSEVHLREQYELFSLLGMVMFLLLYYLGWARFYGRGREISLLYKPLFGIPIPLAFAPIGYFLCAAIIMHSLLLLVSTVLLAIGHIPNSQHTYRHLTNNQ